MRYTRLVLSFILINGGMNVIMERSDEVCDLFRMLRRVVVSILNGSDDSNLDSKPILTQQIVIASVVPLPLSL